MDAQNIKVFTSAPYCFSLGDIAIEQITVLELFKRGFINVPNTPMNYPYIIGGGHILSSEDSWYSRFCVPGRHVLNAPGIRKSATYNFEYLKHYRYVSVRDLFSSAILRHKGIVHEVVPDPGVLITEPDTTVLPPFLEQFGKKYDFVTCTNPCVPPIRTDNKFAVEMQPFIGRKSVVVHNPRIIALVVKNCQFVLTHSLHLAIFALAFCKPFSVIVPGDDEQSKKLRDYFMTIGLQEVVNCPINKMRHNLSKIIDTSNKEKQKAKRHFDNICESLRV